MEERDPLGILVIIGGAWLAFQGSSAIPFIIYALLSYFSPIILFFLVLYIIWAILGILGMMAGVSIMKKTNGGRLLLISGIFSLTLGAIIVLIDFFMYYSPSREFIWNFNRLTLDLFTFCAIPTLILLGGVFNLKKTRTPPKPETYWWME